MINGVQPPFVRWSCFTFMVPQIYLSTPPRLPIYITYFAAKQLITTLFGTELRIVHHFLHPHI